jgi:FixJ family two-component response regulator
MNAPPLVVVIDDDLSVRKALQRLLRAAHLDARSYASASEFLGASLREPDCLVLDVRMPFTTGPELRSQLLAMGRRIPIVFITAHADESPLATLQPREAVEILYKPFDDEALLAAIWRCLDQRRTGT